MTKRSLPPLWLRILLPTLLIFTWFGLAGVGGPYFGKIEEVSSTDLATFLPKSAEATKVNDRLSEFQDNNTIPALVVFEKKFGELSETDTNALAALVDTLQKNEGVEGDISPALVSNDKQAAFIAVPLNSGGEIDVYIDAIKEDVAAAKLSLKSEVTGPASFSRDLNKAFSGIDGILLLTALGVVFVILLIVYRSPLLPILVLLVAISALAASILLVWNLAKIDIVQLNGQVQGILFILVIGAATDYSLLYVSRYREELQKYENKWDATWTALKGSFEPILASGGTVIVGLLCLLVSDLSSNKALGPVGGIGIALAMLSALTFLPAMLYVLGRSVFWPRRPRFSPSTTFSVQKQHPSWHKVAQFVAKHPRAIWLTCAVVLGLAAYAATGIKAEGVSQSNLILGTSEARDGQATLGKHFPDGSGTPVYVIAPQAKADQVAATLDTIRGVDAVAIAANDSPSGQKPLGREEARIKAEIREQVEADLATKKQQAREQIEVEMMGAPQEVIDSVVSSALANIPTADTLVSDIYPFSDATAKESNGDVLLQATLSDPADSDAAKETVVRVREAVHASDNSIIVGGITAVQYDTNIASSHDRLVIIPLILAAITIILMVLLRSIVAPILLLLTTVLSFGATIGIAALLFNHVWNFPGADPSVILYGFVFLVALGIDYNIFLMTRVREETLKIGTRKGVLTGLAVTGGVITSAGIVLAATFAALAVIPILFLAQIAFIVAFGVLLDTFIVRSLLVPALILDIGAKVWWPSKLQDRD